MNSCVHPSSRLLIKLFSVILFYFFNKDVRGHRQKTLKITKNTEKHAKSK